MNKCKTGDTVSWVNSSGDWTCEKVVSAFDTYFTTAKSSSSYSDSRWQHGIHKSLLPDGWMLVPVMPTDEMISRGCDEEVGLEHDYYMSKAEASWDDCERIYAAMLSKAPKYEGTTHAN